MVMRTLPGSRTESGAAVIRVLSYNIRSMRDDRHSLARVIRACAPDVVLIQEAPRFFRWRKHAAWLAKHSDLVTITGGATTTGPMLIGSLRVTVERTEDVLLPKAPGLHRRGFAVAVVRIGGARVGLLSCHLSLRSDERHAQAGMLLGRLKELGVEHVIVGGDINERPEGRSFRRLSAELQDCWAVRPWGGENTYGTDAPHKRIDAIFATGGIEVLGCGVPLDLPGISRADLRAATDHLPVLAALRVPAG
ncbi:endonuclease/exonuclease/phosphatase family protein [Streptomyces sannanensis]